MSDPNRLAVSIIVCGLLAACGGATSPTRTGYAGEWSGTTAQGQPISFTVSPEDKVTSISVGYSFNGCSGTQAYTDLNLETVPNVTCIPGPCPAPISSYRAFSHSASSSDGSATTIHGMFPTLSVAEGVAVFANYPACGTALGVGWTATRR